MTERFADIASTAAHLLTALAGAGHTGITTPASFTGVMPFARVTRIGGPRDRLNDYARLAVDVFDDDYDRGAGLAENIQALLEPGRLRYGAVLIDRVTTDSAPTEVAPWAPGIFRWEARYTLISRRARVAE